MKGFRYLRNVATLRLEADRCTGCGRCAEVCPHGVFSVADGQARIDDRDACMECGACARNCPEGAIDVEAGVGCATGLIEISSACEGGFDIANWDVKASLIRIRLSICVPGIYEPPPAIK